MTQAPTPGPLSGDDVNLLVKGDLLLLDGQPVRFINLFMGGIRADDGSDKRISALPVERFAFIGRPDADGWMPWSGGPNPVPGQRVDFRLRDGIEGAGRRADDYAWKHEGGLGDIIAFRLAPAAPVEASGSEREHGPRCWGMTSASDEMAHCYCGSTDIRTQPSGETRDEVARIVDPAAFLFKADELMKGDTSQYDALNKADRILALVRPAPVASGGQHSSGETETLRVLLDNLVIAQSLSRELREQATNQARSYLYNTRPTQPDTAPVEASGSERVVPVCHEIPLSNHMKVTLEYDPDGSRTAMLWNEANEPIADGDAPDLAALRPQPSGETREAVARIIDPGAWRDRDLFVSEDGYEDEMSASFVSPSFKKTDTILALLSARPLALGGQQGVTLEVWYGSMPESNGKANWTATLRRVNPQDKWDQGFCFARSEYPERVRYEADRMRWLIGEIADKPDILAYDADAHSGYVAPTTPARAEAQDEGAAGEPVAYGADHQPWCQPGDQTDRAFRLRFEDPDMREMVWTGPDAEKEALAAYNKYAPSWNVYLFSGHPRAHPSPTAADADRVRIAVEALEPFALLAPSEVSNGVNMADPLSKWFTVAQFDRAASAIEALKSTAAKEGGE